MSGKAKKATGCCSRIIFAKEALSNQYGAGSYLTNLEKVVLRFDTAFRDHQAIWGNHRSQIQCRLNVCFERAKIAIVDTDQRCIKSQRTVQFICVMHFHQNVHIQTTGDTDEFGCLRFCQRRHDEEDTVRTDQAAFMHLPWVKNEILAKNREATGLTNGANIIGAAMET